MRLDQQLVKSKEEADKILRFGFLLTRIDIEELYRNYGTKLTFSIVIESGDLLKNKEIFDKEVSTLITGTTFLTDIKIIDTLKNMGDKRLVAVSCNLENYVKAFGIK